MDFITTSKLVQRHAASLPRVPAGLNRQLLETLGQLDRDEAVAR